MEAECGIETTPTRLWLIPGWIPAWISTQGLLHNLRGTGGAAQGGESIQAGEFQPFATKVKLLPGVQFGTGDWTSAWIWVRVSLCSSQVQPSFPAPRALQVGSGSLLPCLLFPVSPPHQVDIPRLSPGWSQVRQGRTWPPEVSQGCCVVVPWQPRIVPQTTPTGKFLPTLVSDPSGWVW